MDFSNDLINSLIEVQRRRKKANDARGFGDYDREFVSSDNESENVSLEKPVGEFAKIHFAPRSLQIVANDRAPRESFPMKGAALNRLTLMNSSDVMPTAQRVIR